MTDPEHPAAAHGGLRRALVDELRRIGSLRMPRVEAAFAAVPRHLFVPNVPPEVAYRNQSIQTKFVDGRSVSSSSQPGIMAIMLEQLQLFPGQRVLEIGAGTGYNAALIAHLVGRGGRVTTVDIDEDIVEGARHNLAAVGVEGVEVVCADGGYGWPEAARYDRIVVTVGAPDIAPAWRDQLGLGGRLVVPLSIRGNVQKSIAFEPRGVELTSVTIADCGFMTLRGAFGAEAAMVPLGPGLNGQLTVDDPTLAEAQTLPGLLAGPWEARPTGVRAAPGEVWGGLDLWLALRDPGFASVAVYGDAAGREPVPCTFGYGGPTPAGMTVGFLEAAGLALLAPPAGHSIFAGDRLEAAEFELVVRAYGDAAGPARRLAEAVAGWQAAGRPASDRLVLRAVPESWADGGPLAVRKRWSTLVGEYR